MTTPRKHFNYNSPYAKPVQQYPSQSEDYISLDMGGLTQTHNNASSSSSNEKTPGRYNAKYYQQNLRNSNPKANRRNLFNNNYGQQNNRQSFNKQQHQPYQQQRYGQRFGNNDNRQPQTNNHFSNRKGNNDIASYCHPSMTEDPWAELMQRIRSLEKSKITFKAPTPPKDSTPPSDTNTNSDSDHEDDVNSAASD